MQEAAAKAVWNTMDSSNSHHRSDKHAGAAPSPDAKQDRGGRSGEGAASALAHLKTQARLQRRQLGRQHDAGASAA
jgi:hypothetical protein